MPKNELTDASKIILAKQKTEVVTFDSLKADSRRAIQRAARKIKLHRQHIRRLVGIERENKKGRDYTPPGMCRFNPHPYDWLDNGWQDVIEKRNLL